MKRTALVKLALHPNGSAHHGHKSCADRESQPSATVSSGHRAIGLGECFKDFHLLVGGDAYSSVFHSKMQAGDGGFVGFFNYGDKHFTTFSELDRIPDQIYQNLSNPTRISKDGLWNVRSNVIN